MNDKRDFNRAVDRWLDDGSDATPPRVIAAVLLAVRTAPQERDLRTSWRTQPMKRTAYAVAAVAALAVSLTAFSVVIPRFGIGPGPAPSAASGELGIFKPVAGRIVYFAERSLWAVDPAAPAEPPTRVQLTSEAFNIDPLGWSSDGTRLLIMRGFWREAVLFVLHADGSETQVTEAPMAIRGAAISPDGSRVVFAGSPETPHVYDPWALYAVDADGGPAEVLVESRSGILDDLAFSPDGTQIAYADGAGDNNHHVWVMNADGSNPHEILSQDCACHVYGLAWSPAGDRIALGLEGRIYTFAADGSDFTQIAGGDTTCESARSCAVNLPGSAGSPHWSPDGSQIAYTTGCVEGANAANRDGCSLAIADADGSNVSEFSYGASGPWHPAR